MLFNRYSFLKINIIIGLALSGCTSTRQLAVDFPTDESGDATAKQATKAHPFQALPGFKTIDGDDYYVRLVSEFETKGENILKNGCDSLSPTFKKNDMSSALIFSVRNNRLKFNNEVPGYSYQAGNGNCNYKFEAKKLNVTPWMRLDLGKDTSVDYSIYSSANSNVDVPGLVNKVTAASSLMAFTGVGMGVAVLGQFAGQWLNNTQQQQQAASTLAPPAANNSTESHSLPPFVSYANNSGTLNDSVFKVYAVAEGGINILKADNKPFGELRLYPELTPSLLLKTKADGLPDAGDLSFSEISTTPVKSAAGDINLQQLIEQSQHPEKPNLKPDWKNYDDVQSNCRKLKLVMKDLGFNKFDRNAYLYYFLKNNSDWQNYNIAPQKVQNEEISAKTLQKYRSNNFNACLAADDYVVMKAMGLPVNTESDWALMGDSSQKKEQFFAPLKAIERQFIPLLKNTDKAAIESQLYPLIATTEKGDGTVLLQNRLGEFGLEKLLQPTVVVPTPTTGDNKADPIASAAAAIPATTAIPGSGLNITAQQLAQIISNLGINELSCARIIPEQIGKQVGTIGILLFTTKEGSPRTKGGAMEFEFSSGKINRIAFQSPTYRDFEQDIQDHPEVGECRIDPAFLAKLH